MILSVRGKAFVLVVLENAYDLGQHVAVGIEETRPCRVLTWAAASRRDGVADWLLALARPPA